MSGTEWLVMVSGGAAIGWVNWYFFFADRAAATISGPQGGKQENR